MSWSLRIRRSDKNWRRVGSVVDVATDADVDAVVRLVHHLQGQWARLG